MPGATSTPERLDSPIPNERPKGSASAKEVATWQ